MSLSFASPATAFFRASMPAGLDAGPANTACGICRELYNMGKATHRMMGRLAVDDCKTDASAAGFNSADCGQASEPCWPKQSTPKSNGNTALVQKAPPIVGPIGAAHLHLTRLDNVVHHAAQFLIDVSGHLFHGWVADHGEHLLRVHDSHVNLPVTLVHDGVAWQ